MDPISIVVEFEIATLLLAGVGAVATWLHGKNSERAHQQREMHHREMLAMHERHQKELLGANTAGLEETTEESATPDDDPVVLPGFPVV